MTCNPIKQSKRMTSMKLKSAATTAPVGRDASRHRMIREPGVRGIAEGNGSLEEASGASAGKRRSSGLAFSRDDRLASIRLDVEQELLRLRRLARELDRVTRSCSADGSCGDVPAEGAPGCSVFQFIGAQILHKEQLGKVRSSETYRATLNSFMRFRKGEDLTFDRIDSRMMELYEAEMLGRGLSRNTSSFYLRILRTNYKLAVERGLTPDRRPFKHVYCGMDKTAKRSLSFEEVKRIKELDLSQRPALDFARDMFIFSFCTRGMSFVDMAYLKKQDLKNGYLIYRRKKTGQQLVVEWTMQMQAILDKYRHVTGTQYLLPIIVREDGSERRQYQNQMLKINRRLKDVAALVRLSVPLSLYYSRHSWATIARRKDIPLSVISEGLGHDSEMTTQIYLDSIKSFEVDRANRKILKDL